MASSIVVFPLAFGPTMTLTLLSNVISISSKRRKFLIRTDLKCMMLPSLSGFVGAGLRGSDCMRRQIRGHTGECRPTSIRGWHSDRRMQRPEYSVSNSKIRTIAFHTAAERNEVPDLAIKLRFRAQSAFAVSQ